MVKNATTAKPDSRGEELDSNERSGKEFVAFCNPPKPKIIFLGKLYGTSFDKSNDKYTKFGLK